MGGLDKSWFQTLFGAKPEEGSAFTKLKLADIAEAEGKKNLVWAEGSEADKYKQKFWPEFGKGKWPWCAAFVTWCCEQAGIPDMPVKTGAKFGYTFALVEAWQQWAIERGFYHDNDGKFVPSRGDIVCFDWNQLTIDEKDTDWENHIGVFLSKNGSSFVCAEGNTSNRTGIKSRSSVQIQGFIRIPDGFSFTGKVTEPTVSTSSSAQTFGIDISHWQGDIDWAKADYARAKFVMIKCTERGGYADDKFAINFTNAKKLGKVVGAYHFFRANVDPNVQLDWYFKHYDPHPGDLRPMFDGETMDGVSAELWKDRAYIFCEGVYKRTGKWPFFYSGNWFLKDLGDLSRFKNCPLWIAAYTKAQPKPLSPWSKATIWQYSSSDSLDKNIFYGSETDLVIQHTLK